MARKSTPAANDNVDQNRQMALDRALGDITKRYGDGSIMRLGEAQHMMVEIIPTGSLSLDIALGVGGIPRGRITEIYGPESSGKTTICQHIVAEAQRMGGTCALCRYGACPRSYVRCPVWRRCRKLADLTA
jgi:recombination protein RecA